MPETITVFFSDCADDLLVERCNHSSHLIEMGVNYPCIGNLGLHLSLFQGVNFHFDALIERVSSKALKSEFPFCKLLLYLLFSYDVLYYA